MSPNKPDLSKQHSQPQPNKEIAQSSLSVIGIGASAGGLSALQSFFQAMPADSGLCFVVIVHLSPEHESLLAELLQACTEMPVQQVQHQIKMQPNHVYVIPPGKRLEVSADFLDLADLEIPRGRRLQIDSFFRSLAEHHGDGAAIILSGSGSDGSVGIRSIKEKGGLILVQDPTEAEYDGMPRSAIATGLVDILAPVAKLAEQLVAAKQTKAGLQLPQNEEELGEAAQNTLLQILSQLRMRTGHDFSGYKRSTLLRRIARRMQIAQVKTLSAYLQQLRNDVNETEALFRDLLINVTEFFRDPEAWAVLAETVIPKIFSDKNSENTVRIWAVGCATGEEVYSLAILLLEHAAKMGNAPRIQVFASDLGKLALDFAREGLYPEAISAMLSEERLNRFFTKHNSHYRVRQEVRELVIFTPHNLLQDPPFSKLDLISCRNLLIYLQRDLQERVFESFHYALRSDGYLFLGSAESADSITHLFRTIDKRHRIYQRIMLGSNSLVLPSLPLLPRVAPQQAESPQVEGERQISNSKTHLSILEEVAPPSLLVDAQYNILNLSETAGRYLQHPGGALTSDVLRLIRPELQPELRSALYQAFDLGKKSLSRAVPVRFNGSSHPVMIFVQPSANHTERRRALVIFLEDEETIPKNKFSDSEELNERGVERMRQMEAELHRAQNRFQGIREEYETTLEELRAANEELQSTNEEYKSTLEELETSKEELQSINEELQTVNQEMKNKVDELSHTNSDLQNLFAATEIATLFLNRELRIQRFTPRAARLFNLMPLDRGRPIAHLRSNLSYTELEADAQQVLATLTPIEREVESSDEHRWFLVSVRPYRTLEDHIDGVVITFVDVTKTKATALTLRNLQENLELALEAAQMGTWDVDLATNIAQHDLRHDQIFGYRKGIVNWGPDIFRNHILPEDRETFDQNFARALVSGMLNLEVRIRWPDGTIHWIYDRGRVYYDEAGVPQRMVGVTLDVTERKEAQQAEIRQRLLRGQEAERATLAREIHDGPIQELVGLTFELTAHAHALNNSAQGAKVHELSGRLGHIIGRLRHIMVSLRPPAVVDFGLVQALDHYVIEFQQHHPKLGLIFEAPDESLSLSEDITLMLYRIAQQALYNVVQHASAHNVTVALSTQDHYVMLQVIDDGIGFIMPNEVVDLTRSQHMGIVGMMERAETIGAFMEILSTPGEGTTVQVKLPVI